MRRLAPVGTPVSAGEVFSSLREAGGAGDLFDRFLQTAKAVAQKSRAVSLGSGREALALLLDRLARDSSRRAVVIPGYTCYTVPSAIVRAGLKVLPCDVDPHTLDMDQDALTQMDLGQVLAVIPSSLFGLPSDLARMEALCREYGTHLIDDAAQAMGASVDGRPCGSFGVAGIYSLGRGKNVTSLGGGILVTDEQELAGDVAKKAAGHQNPGVSRWREAARALAYGAFLQPGCYGLAEILPWIELGVSRFDPDFEVRPLTRFQAALATRKIAQLAHINDGRKKLATDYLRELEKVTGLRIPRVLEGAEPVYLRFPFLAPVRKRGELVRVLRRAGLGASTMYPNPVHRIDGIGPYLAEGAGPMPGASEVAECIITLPTHRYVRERDVIAAAKIIRQTTDGN